MPIRATGIGSGLDIESLVTQLVAAESQPTELRLAREESRLQAELSAYGTIKGAVAGLQSAVSQVRSATAFEQKTVTLSDQEALTVTSTSAAQIGSYALEASQLAEAHSLASNAYSAITDIVGTGTLTLKFGTTDYDSGTDTYNSFTQNPDSSTATIVIDSSNNSLQGIRDAINEANAGVSAVIVNDGTGFRLLLNSATTGIENSLEVSITGDGDANDTDNAGLSALAFNSSATNMSQTVAAKDALMTVNGLAITSASNEVKNVIDGVTINLQKVTTQPVTMNVARDIAGVKSAIETFVNGYRAFNAVSNQASAFDEESKTGNILLGDATLRTATSRIRQIINAPIENYSSAFSTLSEIGITTDANGSLNIDSTKLDKALNENFDAIAGLFAAFGQIDDDDIEFAGSGLDTKAGEYPVSISQLATQGQITGTGVLPDFNVSNIVIDADNDALTLEINGIQGSAIAITQGTYTSGESLALELETRLNGVSEFSSAGITVAVSYDSVSNSLTITSDRYGSESKVNITAIDAFTTTTLGFSVSNGTDGLDIIGSIDGVLGVGSGQTLTAAEGTDAEGLVISVTGGATGLRSPIQFSRGVGDLINSSTTDMLAADGLFDARTSGIKTTIEGLGKSLENLRLRMEKVEARFRAQFGALDALVAQLNATGSFLTSALASLPGSAPRG